VSLTVVFQETALRALARIRSEDKAVFARTRHAITALADQPHPDSAVAWEHAALQGAARPNPTDEQRTKDQKARLPSGNRALDLCFLVAGAGFEPATSGL
jgi:hypothetical protein